MAIVSTDKVIIYTGSDGNPTTEFFAPPGGSADYHDYYIPVNEVTGGANITAAWYSPEDNIAQVTGFCTIDVEPAGTQVRLRIAGYDSTAHRVRLRIHMSI